MILETARLLLRPLRMEDAEAVFVWSADPEVSRHMQSEPAQSLDEVRAYIASCENHKGPHLGFGIERKSDGLLMGECGIGPTEFDPWNVWYLLRADCRGQGYATEAVRAMIEHAAQNLGVKDFCGNHSIENPASGRVLLRCGMQTERTGDGHVYYSLHLE